jgi:hypothetical protein
MSIEGKIGSWFGDQRKQEEVRGIFSQMSDIDFQIEDLIYNKLIAVFEQYVEEIRKAVKDDDQAQAEARRFELERELDPIIEELVRFNGALADLVVRVRRRPPFAEGRGVRRLSA